MSKSSKEKSSKSYSKKRIRIIQKTITCFIGSEDNLKKSEDFAKQIIEEKTPFNILGGKKDGYKFYFPLKGKSIHIIDSKGIEYDSTIYFIEDIKNIISGLELKNPQYFSYDQQEYIKLEPKNYDYFILGPETVVKDITYSKINYEELKINYANKLKKLENKYPKLLGEINDNLDYYSKVDLQNELIYYSHERTLLGIKISQFYGSTTSKIIGLYGNYSCGKSISLITLNHCFNFPTLYLNLKALYKSFDTEGYTIILLNELMNLFIKNKKDFEEYKNFIKAIYENKYDSFDKFIIYIIKYFQEWNVLIFLDQFQNKLFKNGDEFLNNLKASLSSPESITNIKIIFIISLNDKSIREVYKKRIMNHFNGIKNEEDIEYIFIKELVKKDSLKLTGIDTKFKEYLELFNYLPLYYSLLLKNKKNIEEFIKATKDRINNKIQKFLKLNENEDKIIQMNEVRLKIDESIDKEFFIKYCDYIPFKYFYIDEDNSNFILKSYFPLIKEIWIQNIYTKSLNFFDGEIKYPADVIGSILELNFINECKNDTFHLGIDCMVELDSLNDMNFITKKTTNILQNKNILITQKNENAKLFDVGFLKARDITNPEMAYIQIKKSLSNNKVNKYDAYKVFENNKEKFIKIFGVKPESCYLIYITLINKDLKKKLHIICEKNKKADNKYTINLNLNKEIIEMIQSINDLDAFCKNNDIILYYFNPNEKIFYTRNDTKFNISELILFHKTISNVTENEIIKPMFLCKKKLKENEYLMEKYNKINLENKSLDDLYIENSNQDKLYLKVIYDFIKSNCIQGKIRTFIFLEEIDTIIYENYNNVLILCLKVEYLQKTFIIKDIINRNYIFSFNDYSKKKLIACKEINVQDYDLLVWVQFKDMTLKGKYLK